ncbi:hypothetical protein HanHA300_Chr05g0166871 [Helianthus annuus]|uniref:Uncharacterized protein n=1 Tax=Helianthus annuus TaxID=4232 RepID=A0A251UNH0_HELAN|nr:hypothetical protein HanHA300_Chr05g0166871 [Helianthus annuus]KAJ0583807.1 hypothetical protein HanHA89_Chr05g0180911 [Helianthus annuus]
MCPSVLSKLSPPLLIVSVVPRPLTSATTNATYSGHGHQNHPRRVHHHSYC